MKSSIDSEYSIFPQMPSGQPHEHIFQTGLPRGQMLQLASLPSNRIEQSRDRQMRLLHTQGHHAVILAHGLYARQCAPGVERSAVRIPGYFCADGKLHHVMTAQALD